MITMMLLSLRDIGSIEIIEIIGNWSDEYRGGSPFACRQSGEVEVKLEGQA